jgi:hypothetical protein
MNLADLMVIMPILWPGSSLMESFPPPFFPNAKKNTE